MNKNTIKSEIEFKTSRSSGSGGQHVNKVSTKVEAHFGVLASNGLSEEEKGRLTEKFKNRITKAGTLVVVCQQTRSQSKNKELVINKLFKLLKKGLYVKPPRKRKGISKNQKAIRLQNKKRQGEKKAMRQSWNISTH